MVLVWEKVTYKPGENLPIWWWQIKGAGEVLEDDGKTNPRRANKKKRKEKRKKSKEKTEHPGELKNSIIQLPEKGYSKPNKIWNNWYPDK